MKIIYEFTYDKKKFHFSSEEACKQYLDTLFADKKAQCKKEVEECKNLKTDYNVFKLKKDIKDVIKDFQKEVSRLELFLQKDNTTITDIHCEEIVNSDYYWLSLQNKPKTVSKTSLKYPRITKKTVYEHDFEASLETVANPSE